MNNFKFERYDENIITRKDGSQGKRGFVTIPLKDTGNNLSVEDKVAVLKQTDRISRFGVPDADKSAMLDKMNAFASLYGFKGNAQEGKSDFIFCNRRPDSTVSFDDILDDSDTDEILAALGFGSR